MSTGHKRLDQALPDGGWPLGSLSELLSEHTGVGELSLLLPTLATVTGSGRWAILVDPPWAPYPPAMRGHDVDLGRLLLVRTRTPEESLWACEQALRGLHGGVVLAWPQNRTAGFARLRRLQLAARTGQKLAFLFRPATAAGGASPAALRLHLHADEQNLHVHVLKCRGSRPTDAIRLRRQHPSTLAGLEPSASRLAEAAAHGPAEAYFEQPRSTTPADALH